MTLLDHLEWIDAQASSGGLGGLRSVEDVGRPDRHELNGQISPWRIWSASDEAGGSFIRDRVAEILI
jgi:hypothetical protein